MFKKTLSICLALLMLLPALVCCTPGSGGTDNTTETPVTAAPEIPVDIVANEATEYIIVRTDDSAETAEIASAVRLREKIKEKTGADIGIKTDWQKRDEPIPEKAKEILVGTTNRPESINAIKSIRQKDFIITVENERVIITGGTDDAIDRAVDYFVEHYVDGEKKKITVFENRREVVRFDYLLGDVLINGTSLRDYVIVYPEGCDLVTYYVAINLADYISDNIGHTLEVVSDKTAEAAHELLIGTTNRALSATASAVTLADDEFTICAADGKVAMFGNSYMVGAAASELVHVYFKPQGDAAQVDVTTIPAAPAAVKFSFPKATSAILFIGDGMGRNHVESALASGLEEFVADRLPNKTYCKTFSQSVTIGAASYTDSAASGTALATGYKSINGYIGLDYTKTPRQNVRELADSTGARTAILTTDVITGATPAAFMCHDISRNNTAILQGQIDELVKKGEIEYEKGSVGNELTACARDALSLISENDSNFFIMIEEAYTDKDAHDNDMPGVISAVKRANDCIAYAIGFVMLHPDTVLLITADHETGGIKKVGDKFIFTSTSHTNTDVPYYALGNGTDTLAVDGKIIDNTDNAKFIAAIFGAERFGK